MICFLFTFIKFTRYYRYIVINLCNCCFKLLHTFLLLIVTSCIVRLWNILYHSKH